MQKQRRIETRKIKRKFKPGNKAKWRYNHNCCKIIKVMRNTYVEIKFDDFNFAIHVKAQELEILQ